MRYAKIRPGRPPAIIEIVALAAVPESVKVVNGQALLVLVNTIGFEPFDPLTQDRTGPVYTIFDDHVNETYTVTDVPIAEARARARRAAEKARTEAADTLIDGIETMLEQFDLLAANAADFDAANTVAQLKAALSPLMVPSQALLDAIAKYKALLAANPRPE